MVGTHCVKWTFIFAVTALWFGLGIWFGCIIEGWRPITALYVMVQIITTIGYGDITFETQTMKMFTAFYILIGLMIIAGLVSSLITSLLEKQEHFVRKQLRSLETTVKHTDGQPHRASFTSRIRDTIHAFNKLIAAFIAFSAFVAAGTVFYRLYEPCTCSYGRTRIERCVDGHLCEETGGAMKSWIDAFYMSVITLTTVGFGDYSPQSYYGRWFGVFWMLLGVAATGNFINVFSEFFLVASRDKMEDLQAINAEIFDTIPKNTPGRLTKTEFRVYALEQLKMVKKHDVMQIDHLFQEIDSNHDGLLSRTEVKEYFDALDKGGKVCTVHQHDDASGTTSSP